MIRSCIPPTDLPTLLYCACCCVQHRSVSLPSPCLCCWCHHTHARATVSSLIRANSPSRESARSDGCQEGPATSDMPRFAAISSSVSLPSPYLLLTMHASSARALPDSCHLRTRFGCPTLKPSCGGGTSQDIANHSHPVQKCLA